jgi:hypothetical protein
VADCLVGLAGDSVFAELIKLLDGFVLETKISYSRIYFKVELVLMEGQAWCSGESCLTKSPGHGSKQPLRRFYEERLALLFPFSDPTHMGASGTGSALCPLFSWC